MNKEKNTNETMGLRIRMQRRKLGMTQEQLAAKLYVTKATISFYENDSADIKASVISELATILRTSPDYLIWGVEEDKESKALEPDTARLVAAFESIADPKIRQIVLAQIEAVLTLEV